MYTHKPSPPLLVYKLDIKLNSKPSFSVTLDNSAVKGFTDFAKQPGAKIYLLMGEKLDATVYYVGETIQPMQERFRDGINVKKEKCYSWAESETKYRLFVWNLEAVGGGRPLKSIEAELVFCVRVAQKAWPKAQTGINFHHLVDAGGYQHSPYIALDLLSQTYGDLMQRANAAGNAERVASLKIEAADAIELLKNLVF